MCHDQYAAAWQRMAESYCSGLCVSERAMQFYLASNLSAMFGAKKLVIEPSWKTEFGHFIPDIVMFEGDKITDIFELKFVPHGYANFETDIRKLWNYAKLPDTTYPVRIKPTTGQWTKDGCSNSPSLSLHYVVIARHESEAVWPERIYRDNEGRSAQARLNHWYGRVGERVKDESSWSISYGI